MPVTWLLVEGGECGYGDEARPKPVGPLLWTATPVTRGQIGLAGEGDLPLTALNQAEAAAIAAALGGRLLASAEWEWMASGGAGRRYPWGEADWEPALAVLGPAGHDGPLPAGTCPARASRHGILDVAGNVWEWTSSRVLGEAYVIRGGSYASPPLYARATFLNAAPAELRSPGIGLRVVRQP